MRHRVADESRDFQTKPCYVDVETKGELTRGATVVDFYNVLQKNRDAIVAYDVDREAFLDYALQCD